MPKSLLRWLLLLLPIAAAAQLPQPGSSLLLNSGEFLPVSEAYKVDLAFADATALHADWRMTPGYYLYRTRFALHTPAGQIATAEFAPGVVKYDEFFEQDLEVYYDATRVTWRGPFSAGPLILEFQGCADAGLCYPPAYYRFSVDPAAGSVQPLGQVGRVEFDEPTGESLPEFVPVAGLLAAIGLAFLGGMVLNLMPCVFPVLALKALSLARGGNSDRGGLALQSMAYLAGNVATALLLAAALLAARAAGSAVGWGFQLQSPAVIAFLLFLFAVMALSLSGTLTIGTALMGLGTRLEQGTEPRHAFATGALAMFVASPCTAPFMAVALGYALVQPWYQAAPVFAALGAGMAMPIVVLSLFPALLRYLPRPGPWLETFKQALAFPLALTCIWLLWILGRQLGADGTALVLSGLLGLLLAAWASHRLGGRLRAITVAAGIAAALLATMQGLAFERTAAGTSASVMLSPSSLQARVGTAQPVFVNLTADWCITCLVNEKRALDTERTRQLFAEHDVLYLVGDWTRQDEGIAAILAQHGRAGVPLYLFFPAHATTASVLPQFLNQSVIDELFTES